ncbi:MAG TPA: hypothetical protein VM869_33790 [Enhygromyxa sp.]|nr:hypothetical protein [Enhygromyxa sp.]
MKPSGVVNRIAASPITLSPVPNAWRSIPEVPIAVQDGFGPKAIAVLQRGRWRGLVPRAGASVFAWLDGRELRATRLSTRVTRSQTLESDEAGRALVIGGTGNSLYAVEPSGAATCLGVLPDGETITTACWLPRGGVAMQLGRDLCIHTPGPAARLLPRLRFRAVHPEYSSLRSLPIAHDDVFTIAAMYDDRGAIYAIDDAGRAHILAEFEQLAIADIQLFMDETGYRTMLPDGPTISIDGSLATVDHLEDAIARREQLPEIELSVDPAPELDAGQDLAPPDASEAKLEVRVSMPLDALIEPSLDRLGTLTTALIRMLRAAPQRSAPNMEILKLIRSGMPHDLRAYIHAWATHAPLSPAVYEFWMEPPKLESREFIREHAGDAISLGTFASGEPILARLSSSPSCEVVMIDDEGVPYRYRGLEGFLLDLQLRADGAFELDDWIE